jgi:hypothetical protein
MPIRISKKVREGMVLMVEGTAQLLDETTLDAPTVLQECTWQARIEPGRVLWDVDILRGDDLRGYIQAELQKRTKRR